MTTTLDQLKERFQKLSEWDREQDKQIPSAYVFLDLCQDLIRLCEAYRKLSMIEISEIHLLRKCGENCTSEKLYEVIEKEADRLFEGEK